MSAIDHLLHANQAYVADFPGPRPVRPKLGVAVVSCMDSRIDLFSSLGLRVGEAHLLRNAGGLPTDDMLRSLAISQRKLGTREIMLIHHTDCGMKDFDDPGFRAQLAAESGAQPPWDVAGFSDPAVAMRTSLRRVRECGWLPCRDEVRGFVFDVATGALTEVLI
jgi:carbonic anhydrase